MSETLNISHTQFRIIIAAILATSTEPSSTAIDKFVEIQKILKEKERESGTLVV